MTSERLRTLDLSQLPKREDGVTEYKGSETDEGDIPGMLQKAASAFWNSGGGMIFFGINKKTGDVDGGIRKMVGRGGREDIRSWVDTHISKMYPHGRYECDYVDNIDGMGRGTLSEGNCVLVVEFFESEAAPHWTPEHKCYVRVGEHSGPAPAPVIEALFARRGITTPELVHTLRARPGNSWAIQLGIVAVNDEPARDVVIQVAGSKEIRRAVIDQRNPYFVDLAYNYAKFLEAEYEPFNVTVTYRGREATSRREYQATVDLRTDWPGESLMSIEHEEKIGALDSIRDSLKQMAKSLADCRDQRRNSTGT